MLMLPNEVRIGQNSDHREIARFLSLPDRNHRPLRMRLEIFKNEIVKKLQSFNSTIPSRETVSLGIAVSVIFSEAKKSTAPVYIYECPSHPYNTFRGRKNVLEQMDCYFDPNPAQSSRQLRFAFCSFSRCFSAPV